MPAGYFVPEWDEDDSGLQGRLSGRICCLLRREVSGHKKESDVPVEASAAQALFSGDQFPRSLKRRTASHDQA